MDHLQTRLDALEQQMHTINRRLRWWRGLAGGLLVLAVLTWALPSGTAQEAQPQKTLEERVAALETVLQHFSRTGNEVILTGANLRIVNGLGRTDCTDAQGAPLPNCPNGLGNLIVGYNEPRDTPEGGEDRNVRTGSHNVVVGRQHNFSRVGGLVVGAFNAMSGDFAVVSGGQNNVASGEGAAVSGGLSNRASGSVVAVSGGLGNTASGEGAAVSGGAGNRASGEGAAVSGGEFNRASGPRASVAGGSNNTANGMAASVSGGGRIDQETESGWAAGSEGKEVFGGNFRSP